MEKNKKDGVIERWERAIRQNVGVPLEEKIINPFAEKVGSFGRTIQEALGVAPEPPTKNRDFQFAQIPKKTSLENPELSDNDELVTQQAEDLGQFREKQRTIPSSNIFESAEGREALKMRVKDIAQKIQERKKLAEEQENSEKELLRQKVLQKINQYDIDTLRRTLDNLDRCK